MQAEQDPSSTEAPAAFAAWSMVLLLAVFGLLFHLDDRLLCPDEAETALLGRSVLEYGVPMADDGRNEIGVGGGADWNEDGIYTWSPWIDEYTSAASQALFGQDAFAARLPFALLGVAAFVLFARTAWVATRDHGTALAAAGLLATSVPFLLHARQCRYYAPLLLGQAWLLWAFVQLLKGRRRSGTVHLALALTLQFYGNYVVVPGNALALGLTALLLWKRQRHLLGCVVAAGAMFAALAAPWLLFAGTGKQTSALSTDSWARSIPYLLTQTHHHVLPWVVFLVPLVWWLVRRVRGTSAAPTRQPLAPETRGLALLCVAITVCHLTVLSFSPLLFFRYLIPLMVVLPFLAALIVTRCLPGRVLPLAAMALLAFTNWISVATGTPLPDDRDPWLYGERQWTYAAPYPRFLASLFAPYRDTVQVVAEYLQAEADPEDVVWSPLPEMTLIYHTGLRFRDARSHKLDLQDLPRWILTSSPSDPVQNEVLLTERMRRKYKEVVLDAPAVRMGPRRPDPNFREAFTPPDRLTYTLLRRKRD